MKAGITSKTISSRKSIMYSIHQKTTAQLFKLKKQLYDNKIL